MDIGRAFSAPFKDPAWLGKCSLGAVILLVPIANFAVSGYGLAYARNVYHGDERLPEWSDFGRHWVRGLAIALASAVYLIPAIAIAFAGILPPLMASGLPSVARGDADPILAALSGTMTLLLVAVLYVVAVSVLLHAAFINYAVHDEFGALFRFSEIWQKVNSRSGYFVAWLASYLFAFIGALVAGVAAAALGMIPCIGTVLALPVGAFVGIPFGLMVQHAFGQYAKAAYGGAPTGGFGAVAPAGYAPVSPITPVAPTAFAPPAVPSTSAASPSSGAFVPSMPSVPGSARPRLTGTVVAAEEVPEAPEKVAASADGGTIVVPRPQPAEVEPPVPVSEGDEAADAAEETEDASLAAEQPVVADSAEPRESLEEPVTPVEPAREEPEADAAVDVARSAPASATGVPASPVEAPAAEPSSPVSDGPVTAAPAPVPPVRCAPGAGTIIERPDQDLVEGGWLYEVKGNEVGRSWRLPKSDMKIGRDLACGVCIADGKVSREHAKVQFRDDRFRILDMGSSNGTFVNDERIDQATYLKHKDLVRVGQTVFEFREQG